MSFDDFEESDRLGHPINLYKFLTGPGEASVLRYTDHDVDYDVDEGGAPVIYSSVPIKRSVLEVTGTLDRAQLTITLPREATIAELFRQGTPSYLISVFIFQTHVGDPDKEYIGIWSGRVVNCKFEGLEAVITCDPIATALRRPGLRRNWQISCPHALYGPQCRAPRIYESALVDAVLNANTIDIIPGLPLQRPPADYLNGTMQWDVGTTGRVAVRNILGIVNNAGVYQINTLGGLEGLQPGDTIQILRGCRHDRAACLSTHNNSVNYGGQPWIPITNPVNSTTLYI